MAAPADQPEARTRIEPDTHLATIQEMRLIVSRSVACPVRGGYRGFWLSKDTTQKLSAKLGTVGKQVGPRTVRTAPQMSRRILSTGEIAGNRLVPRFYGNPKRGTACHQHSRSTID